MWHLFSRVLWTDIHKWPDRSINTHCQIMLRLIRIYMSIFVEHSVPSHMILAIVNAAV